MTLDVPAATDSCGGKIGGTTNDPRTYDQPGTYTVHWTYTDASGNSSTQNQTVVIGVDTTPPTITACATNKTITADASCAVMPDLTGDVDAFDDCSGITVTQSPAAGTVLHSGSTPVTFTVTDGSGNSAHCSSTVTVVDNTPPTIIAPPAVTAYTGAGAVSCDTVVTDASLGTASASDNCVGVSVSRSPSGNTFSVGTTDVVWTATDAAGNKATAHQSVTVIDNTPPTINYPANGVVAYLPLNSTATSIPVSFTVAAGDNCPGVKLDVTPASNSIFPVGVTTVTATATDGADPANVTTVTFTVTVLYDFTGFFSPVANTPTLNTVKAGSAVPLKFSLSGNKGLNILLANSPQSGVIPCDASAPVADLTDTVTASNISLTYDATSDQYIYVWKTSSTWTGCRQLVVTLNDGSQHVTNFKFK